MRSNDEKFKSILEYIDRLDHIDPGEIPGINLYMDQVLTFMNERLSGTQHKTEGPVITKTMINNYAKNHLFPSPVKKKYSRDHILMLILILYYKNVVSLSDIEEILTPLGDRYTGPNAEPDLPSIYREVFSLETDQRERLKQDIREKFDRAKETFPEAEAEDRERLQLFAFLSELAFDVYLKKEMIELVADELRSEHPDNKKHK